MPLPSVIEKSFFYLADALMATLPRCSPRLEALQKSRVISHRGEVDEKHRPENTFAAFDPLVGSGVWAIELDVCWTKDLHPVVSHDSDCQRVFRDPIQISQVTLAELQQRIPQLPSLAQLIQRYQGKLHLMIELKGQAWQAIDIQRERLKNLMAPLTPQKDYHFISLDPEPMFAPLDFLPPASLLPIVYTDVKKTRALVERHNYGGILGHYAFIHAAQIRACQQGNKIVGTGFIHSKNCLLRELNRGISYIYTDNALKIQSLIEKLKNKRRES